MTLLRLLLVLLLSLPFTSQSQTSNTVSGQLFVQLKASAPLNLTWAPEQSQRANPVFSDLIGKYGISKVSCPFKLNNEALQRTYLFEFDPNANTEELIRDLEKRNEIKYAEHVPTYQTSYVPNDPQYGTQWHLQTIQAELAWDVITTQTNSVVVAVVDDAILLTHEDLQPSIWTNTGEVPGDNIDNDGNGYIDDVNGWDAANNDNDANPDNPTNTFFSHGTHCAGIAAARTDNAIGIASIGFNAQIMPIKAASLPNPGSIAAGYAGVEYAIINGADVISLSWGGPGYSATYQLIFDQAYAQGIVCVAAAGNSNSPSLMYPASYNHVISVGATDQNDQKATFSNYGSAIDVMAPGVGIYSSLAGSNSSYGSNSGTSMACPMVAGLAALMLACDPNLSPDDVENCIESSADDIYPVNSSYTGQLGAGRINAANAMACVKELIARFEVDYELACPGQNIQFTDISPGTPTYWEWYFPGGTPASSNVQNPVVSYAAPGSYDVTLIVSDGTNWDTLVKPAYITVAVPSATLSGGSTILPGYTGYIEFNFTGNPPFTVNYTDGINNFTESGITANPYYHPVNPTDTTTYTITGFADAGCSGNISGSAIVNVIPQTASSSCYYTKVYGDIDNNSLSEIYHDVAEDATYAVGRHDTDGALFCRFNSNGDLSFAVQIESFAGGFSDIAPAPNGDKVCLGSDNEDIIIARFTNTGTLVWARRYDIIRERSPDIIVSQGDSYIIGCWYSTGGSSDNAAFMRIDGLGNIIWETSFHSLDDQIYEMVPNGTGGAIFSGGIHGGGSVDMFVGEIDVNGVFGTIAEYNHSTNVMNEAYQVIKTMNNEYVAMSKLNPSNTVPFDANILRMDANFDKLWEVNFTYGGNGRIRYIDDVVEDSHGDLYVSCRYEIGSPDIGVVLKFDANGNFLWSKQLTDTRALKLSTTSSTPTDNLMVARFHTGVNNGGLDLFLARTDTSLNSCIAAPVPTSFLPGVSTRTNLPFSVSNIQFTITNLTPVFTPLTYSTITICEDCSVDTCTNEVTANFFGSDVCLGDTSFFVDQSTTTVGNIGNWNWDFGDGSMVGGTGTPGHQYQNPGAYDVTLIVNNDSIPLCFDTLIVTVNVADATLELPPDSTICLGDSLLLQLEMGCNASSYGWDFSWTPAGSMNDPTLQQPTVSPTSTTTYTVVATKNGDTLTGSVTITVDLNCCVSHAAFEPTTWCEGENPPIVNTSSSTGATTYTWDFGPNVTPSTYVGTTPPPLNFNGIGLFPVTLILDDDCGSDTLYQTININGLPIAYAGIDTSFCGGGSVEVGDSLTSGYEYSWTPAGLVDDPTDPHPIATYTTDTTLIVTVTDTWTGCTNSDTVVLTNIPLPEFDFGPDAILCNGASLTLDPGVGGTVAWQDGSISPTYTVTQPGTYYATVTSDVGSCEYSDTILVSTATLPAINLGDDYLICEGSSAVLSPESTVPGDYLWNTGSTQPVLEVTEFGEYILTYSNGCGTASDTIVIGDLECNCSVYFPNTFTPDADEFNQVFKAEYDCIFYDFNLKIYNRWGEVIFESFDPAAGWDATYSGRIVQSGTYTWTLRYTSDNGIEKTLTGHVNVIK
ncbi:MAG: S8 family serine peptidase [Crocinitomicaceae bacterium]